MGPVTRPVKETGGINQIRSYGTGSGHLGTFKVCKGIAFEAEKKFCFTHSIYGGKYKASLDDLIDYPRSDLHFRMGTNAIKELPID